MKCPVLEAWEKAGLKKWRPCGGDKPGGLQVKKKGEILLGLLVLCVNYEMCFLNDGPGFSP